MAFHPPRHGLELWKPGIPTSDVECLCCKRSIRAGRSSHYAGDRISRSFLCDPCWAEWAGRSTDSLNLLSRFRIGEAKRTKIG